MNPLIAEIKDKELAMLRNNANADAKIYKVRRLAMTLSEMALKDEECLLIMENALAKMCINTYKKRIVTLPDLLIEKH